ncbi:hypothetical protein ES703_97159 [subsurface metagenome]
MKIKQQDEQRMVIAPPLVRKLISIPIALIIQIVCILFVDWPWLIFSFSAGLFVLFELTNIFERVIIDKPTESIIVRKPLIWFIPRWRNISFSAVMSVDVDHKKVKKTTVGYPHAGFGNVSESWHDAWRVSLNTGDKKIKIDQTGSETDMQYLAREMRRFIGMEQLFKLRKEATEVKEATEKAAREEAVARWKTRIEADKEEKK